jgi:hypothetical protein
MVEFTVAGIPCLGLNGGPAFKHNEAFSFQIATSQELVSASSFKKAAFRRRPTCSQPLSPRRQDGPTPAGEKRRGYLFFEEGMQNKA